jgi:HK97 family phage major capsid protein
MYGNLAVTETTDGGVMLQGDIKGAGVRPLRAAKEDLRAYLQRLTDSVKDARRALTQAEKRNLDQVREWSAAIATELTVAEARAESDRHGGVVVDPDALAAQRAQQRVPGMPRSHPQQSQSESRPLGRYYVQLFPETAHASSPFASDAEFLNIVASGRHDPRLTLQAATGTMTSGDGPSGLVVPDEMAGRWWDRAVDLSIVMKRASVWPLRTSTRSVPSWNLSDRSSGAVAGLTLQWIPEGSTSTPQVAVPRLIKLHARKAGIYIEISNELLADGLDMDAQLRLVLGKAMSYGLDEAFIWGAGAGMPLGALTSGAAISITRTTAGTIDYLDILAMYARLDPAATDAVWLASPSTLPSLATLNYQIGAGGQLVPILKSDNGRWELLTKELIFTDHMKPLGTAGDLALASFGSYIVGARKEMSIETSAHVGFMKDTQNYRILIRVDGQPADAVPTTPANGGATTSSFIKLA